jgi:hypothetical protein
MLWPDGPGTPWESGGSIQASVVSCGQPVEGQLGAEGEFTIELVNRGTERREGKARVVVVSADGTVPQSLRTTLNPGQSGRFVLGHRVCAGPVACRVLEPPVERDPGNEDKDPNSDEACCARRLRWTHR